MGPIPWSIAVFVVFATAAAMTIVIFLAKRSVAARVQELMGDLPERASEGSALRTIGLGSFQWSGRQFLVVVHPSTQRGMECLPALTDMIATGRLVPIEADQEERVAFVAATEGDADETRRICLGFGVNVDKSRFTLSNALDAAASVALDDATGAMTRLSPALSGSERREYAIGGIVVETLDVPAIGGSARKRVTVDWIEVA